MADKFNDKLNLYNIFLRTEKNLSRNTINSYNFDLKYFFDYLEEKKISSIDKVDETLLNNFLSYIRKSKNKTGMNYADKSVTRMVSSLKGFFRFMESEGLVKSNPAEILVTPRSLKQLPEVLSVQEIDMILSKIDLDTDAGIRDRALLETMYASGLRVSEVMNLDAVNLYLKEGFLRITGKGSKERIVPIGSSAIKYLRMYIDGARERIMKNKSGSTVFLNLRGGKLSRMGIWNIFKKYCTAAKIEKNIHPHSLRHSFATHMLEGGADILIVKELLGHSDISTTQIYTHIDKEFLTEVHKTFHPRG
ncbi:MAG TPA: site-specific tyrosine recombinase XerD [Ignavibacteria bacterium]|nr:site-specific tyrosine recombinase XerD [Ignavibacteria bacterium]